MPSFVSLIITSDLNCIGESSYRTTNVEIAMVMLKQMFCLYIIIDHLI